jgi:putative CocE/NonD family hydrolase
MFYQGGVFRKELLEGWLPATGQAERLAFYKSRPRFDDFWRDFDADARAAEVTAPALFVGGWQDIFCQGTIDAFAAREKSGGPGAKGHNYLIMTWGTHGPDISKDYKFAENRFDVKIEQAAFTFFAAHLQGKAEALKALPKVQYYVMGADTEGAPGNEWRSADAWPPFTAEPVPYYLHADGTLSPEKPRETGASLAFDFDPADPVPTLGGANLNIPAGPFDQRPLAERQDILRFTTAPLDAPLEITGRVVCRLFVSSDAPDTDFTAKLVDVYPAGDEREILLLDGIRRVKTRLGYDRTAPLLTGPEEIVEVEIDLQSIGFVFDKGHRIGLHVSSSNHPRFEVNPNTGADFPGEGEPPRIARNVVYAEAAHAGALYLPVRPGRAAPGRDSSLRTE